MEFFSPPSAEFILSLSRIIFMGKSRMPSTLWRYFNWLVTTGLLIRSRPDFTSANTGLQKQAHSWSCSVALFSVACLRLCWRFWGACECWGGLVVLQGRGKARRCCVAQRSGSGPSTAPSTPRSTTTSTGTASRAWTCQSKCGLTFSPLWHWHTARSESALPAPWLF